MKRLLLRLALMLFGNFLIAIGVVFNLRANIGYSPWEVLHTGMARTIGITIGQSGIIVGVIVVTLVTILGEKLGIGSIIAMTVTALFIDGVLATNIIPLAPNLTISFVMLFTGYIIVATGTYFYMRSALGAGPRDSLMVVLIRRTKLQVGVCRCIVELLVTVIGWSLGGMVGIGTVIAVIALGPIIQLAFKVFRFDVAAVKHESLTDMISAVAWKKHEKAK